tara:strand:- start:608 stop:796 length:189 start_codon:yes stop_codon:yes gene_type:complete
MTRQEMINLLMKPVQAQANAMVNEPEEGGLTNAEIMKMHDDIKKRYEGMSDMQLRNIVVMNF